MKKLSILGLVLMAASAVTAAFIPSKESSYKQDLNGSCKGNAATVSCFDNGAADNSCLSSAFNNTSNAGAAENATTGGAGCSRT